MTDRDIIKQLQAENKVLKKRCSELEEAAEKSEKRIQELGAAIRRMSAKRNDEIKQDLDGLQSTEDLIRQYLDDYSGLTKRMEYSTSASVCKVEVPNEFSPPKVAYTIRKGTLTTVLTNTMRYVADINEAWEGEARLPRSNYLQNLFMYRDEFNSGHYQYIDHDVIKHTVCRIRKQLKKKG